MTEKILIYGIAVAVQQSLELHQEKVKERKLKIL